MFVNENELVEKLVLDLQERFDTQYIVRELRGGNNIADVVYTTDIKRSNIVFDEYFNAYYYFNGIYNHKKINFDDVRIIDEYNFIEITKDGIETYFKITECIKYQSWIFEIENKNIKGTWVGKFYADGDKTILDFTENIVSKKSILKPFISLYLKRQQKIYFRDLKVKLNCEEFDAVR